MVVVTHDQRGDGGRGARETRGRTNRGEGVGRGSEKWGGGEREKERKGLVEFVSRCGLAVKALGW